MSLKFSTKNMPVNCTVTKEFVERSNPLRRDVIDEILRSCSQGITTPIDVTCPRKTGRKLYDYYAKVLEFVLGYIAVMAPKDL